MRDPSGAVGRAGRSGLFACTALALGVVAHVLGDGAMPSPAVLAVALTLAWVASWIIAGRERGFAFLALSMLAVQTAMHEGFMAAAMSQPTGTEAGRGAFSTALAGIPVAKLLCTVHGHATSAAGMSASRPMGTAVMLVTHGIAAVLLAAILRFGEATVWALARQAAKRLPRWSCAFSQPVLEPINGGVAIMCAVVRVLTGKHTRQALQLRGPPRSVHATSAAYVLV